jgi:rhodanese-related sulfurtransferase
MRYMKRAGIITIILLALMLVGCTPSGPGIGQVMDGDGMVRSFDYTQITQEEAKRMMEQENDYVIVDVRREDEYAEGHIPGAILIPNESIAEYEAPEELTDSDQIILVYCRTGRRSKEAADKLAKMGYSRVYEFGGIVDWDGEIEVNEQNTEQTASTDEKEDMTPTPILGVIVGDSVFTIYTEDNSSTKAFIEEVNHGNVQIDMHDYGNFEKVGDLPWDLPTNDEEITTVPGDVILYQGNKITIYYDENTWNFTKLGHINATPEEIREAFGGKDDITAEFFVEWTE